VELRVFMAVTKRSTNFWAVVPCSPLKVNRRFGGTYRLHHQDRRANQGTRARLAAFCWFLAWNTILP
jgi:hypothetical protein